MPSASSAAKRSSTEGCFTALAASSASRRITATGVFAGALMPYHCVASNPGKPCSATVPTSGMVGRRLSPATAMARSLPDFTCGMRGGVPAEVACVRPARRSIRLGPVPL
jgi:hypothetical protein